MILSLCLILFSQTVWSQTLSETDRIRLAEAFRLGEKLSEKVWKDWSKAPFAVLLVTPEHEFLIRHPSPSNDFTGIGYDQLLKSQVYRRKKFLTRPF